MSRTFLHTSSKINISLNLTPNGSTGNDSVVISSKNKIMVIRVKFYKNQFFSTSLLLPNSSVKISNSIPYFPFIKLLCRRYEKYSIIHTKMAVNRSENHLLPFSFFVQEYYTITPPLFEDSHAAFISIIYIFTTEF